MHIENACRAVTTPSLDARPSDHATWKGVDMDTAEAVSRGPHSMILGAVAPQGLKALPPRLLDCLFYISSEDKEKWLGDWIRMLSRLSEGKDGGGVQAEGTPEAVTLEDLFSRWPLTSLYQDRKITEPALQESKAARTRWLGHHSLFAALAWMPGSMVAGLLPSSTEASDVAAPDDPLASGTTSSGSSTQTTPTVSLHQLTRSRRQPELQLLTVPPEMFFCGDSVERAMNDGSLDSCASSATVAFRAAPIRAGQN